MYLWETFLAASSILKIAYYIKIFSSTIFYPAKEAVEVLIIFYDRLTVAIYGNSFHKFLTVEGDFGKRGSVLGYCNGISVTAF